MKNLSKKCYLIPELDMYLVKHLPKFSCKRCARCCTGKFISLYKRDVDRITPYVKKFHQKTTNMERALTGAKYKMIMNRGKCIFLEGNRCKHYDLRPNTCRRYPFIVTERYSLVSSTCIGINWNVYQKDEEYQILSAEIAKGINSFLDRMFLQKQTKP